jgi:hypothetical protein
MLDQTIDLENWTDQLMLLSGVGWALMLGLAMAEMWFPSLVVGTFLVAPWFIIGAGNGGEVSVKLLVYPLALWIGITTAAFIIARITTVPETLAAGDLITGFTPGFAAAYWGYWIGGFFTMTLSYGIFFRSDFLPEEAWEEFLEDVEDVKGEQPTEPAGASAEEEEAEVSA